MSPDPMPNSLQNPQSPALDHIGSSSRRSAVQQMITDQVPSTSLYSDPPPYAYPFAQDVDLLSWGSSGLNFGQPHQIPTNAFSHAMTLNFKTNNDPGVGAPLEILNAESYNYGGQDMPNSKRRSKRPQVEEESQTLPFGITKTRRGDSTNSNTPRVSSEEHDGRRRKKPRVEILSDEEDALKKARGRPRLDTKDETAADRRRTQIRNAQRAYRSRKETTISSLESQVQELRGSNEEMSNMFINLYEFAVGKKILQREPEFAQHFTSYAERFLSLAKAPVGEESSKEDEPVGDDGGKRNRSKPELQLSNSSNSQTELAMMIEASPRPPDAVGTWGGYEVSHEVPSIPDDMPSELQHPFGYEQNGSDLQLITQATPDNASFFDMMQDMQQYRVEIPQEVLPMPHSFAYSEKSFARRLTRLTCQEGLKLITAPSPPPQRFKNAFSFVLRYSSKADIKTRLEQAVFSSAKDSLQAWKEPFIHLGGAGTYYPTDELDKEGMPKFNTGMSIGPFREEIISTQEKFLQDDFKTFMPGFDFEGQFFDPNDVEHYLRGRGIIILDDMQYVSVDLEALVPYEASEPRSTGNTAQTVSPRTPMSSQASLTTHENHLTAFPEYLDTFDLEETTDIYISKPDAGPTLPRFADWDTEQYNIASPPKTEDPFNLTTFNAVPIQEHANNISGLPNNSQRKRISLSVNTLIEYLAERTVCLGRAPGIRPADVEDAIWTAVREAVSV